MGTDEIHDYHDLIVWQKSMDLVVLIYRFTKNFPKEEQYGLIAQMRRAATSIPSNIAEGRSRGTRRDYRHFLLTAYGSGSELETQIEICTRLDYGNPADRQLSHALLKEILKMLNKMVRSLAISDSP